MYHTRDLSRAHQETCHVLTDLSGDIFYALSSQQSSHEFLTRYTIYRVMLRCSEKVLPRAANRAMGVRGYASLFREVVRREGANAL